MVRWNIAYSQSNNFAQTLQIDLSIQSLQEIIIHYQYFNNVLCLVATRE